MSISKLSLDGLLDADVELNDRERLALAFGILREQGWFAPIEWSSTLCCANHGWVKVCEHFEMSDEQWMETDFEDEPPTIWWNSQSDSMAFYGKASEAIMSAEMEARVDAVYEESGSDEDAVVAWMIEHQDELDADEHIERTTHFTTLIDTLPLNWSGGMSRMHEAVEVLRSVGLIVTEAVDPNRRITIHPVHTPMMAKLRDPDDRIALWFNTEARIDADTPHTILTRADAQGLIEMLQTILATDPEPQT